MCFDFFTIALDKLLAIIPWRNSIVRRREAAMKELMTTYYFAALIKTIRTIHAELRRLGFATSHADLLRIANIVVQELSPTAAQATCYNRELVLNEFGEEFDNTLERLLDVCVAIDCNTSPGAPIPLAKNVIEPMCIQAEGFWNGLVDIYIQNVSFFGRVRSAIKKRVLELRIAAAVPRRFPYPIQK